MISYCPTEWRTMYHNILKIYEQQIRSYNLMSNTKLDHQHITKDTLHRDGPNKSSLFKLRY